MQSIIKIFNLLKRAHENKLFLFSKRLISHILIPFLFVVPFLQAETIIVGKEEYEGILWGEEESFDVEKNGTFLKNENDFIICAGKAWKGESPKSLTVFKYGEEIIDNMGVFNNRAVKLIESGIPSNREAAEAMLNAGIQFDPVFFPFRYNLGRLYYLEQRIPESMSEFEKAKDRIPGFYRTYMHIAFNYKKVGKMNEWEYYLKKSHRLNPYSSEPILYLAEYYYREGFKRRAMETLKEGEKYHPYIPHFRRKFRIQEKNEKGEVLKEYDKWEEPDEVVVLSVKEHEEKIIPYQLIGQGIFYSIDNSYSRALRTFKKVNQDYLRTNKIPYTKNFHYYFAEVSYKSGDAKTASEEYGKLLESPFDLFFQEISYSSVERKRKISEYILNEKKPLPESR